MSRRRGWEQHLDAHERLALNASNRRKALCSKAAEAITHTHTHKHTHIDICVNAVDAFAAHFNLPTATTTCKAAKTTKVTVVLDSAAVASHCKFGQYCPASFGLVRKDKDGNYATILSPVVMEHTSYTSTDKAPARTKVLLHLCTSRWQGDEFDTNASIFAANPRSSTMRYTRRYIYRVEGTRLDDEDKEAAINRSMWEVENQLRALADFAAIHNNQVNAQAIFDKLAEMSTELTRLAEEVQECAGSVRMRLLDRLTGARETAELGAERLTGHLRPFDIAGFRFHPDTECENCLEAPIVGWRYTCKKCKTELCEGCGRAHNETHTLELHKLPPVAHAGLLSVIGQKYKVDGVVDRRVLKKAKNGQPVVYEYKVKWEGYHVPTWETAANLNNNALVAGADSALQAQETRRRGKKRMIARVRCARERERATERQKDRRSQTGG